MASQDVILGFTGTRDGMSVAQKYAIHSILQGYRVSEIHHGACVGADADFALMAKATFTVSQPPVKIIAHPGRSASDPPPPAAPPLQSTLSVSISDEVREEKGHFARNRDIVDTCDVLIACPGSMTEHEKGGTWYTINYARKQGRSIVIVWPDGSVTRENQ